MDDRDWTDPPLMTPDEFVGRLWDRGIRVKVVPSTAGRPMLTDGKKKRYVLAHLVGGVMRATEVASALDFVCG